MKPSRVMVTTIWPGSIRLSSVWSPAMSEISVARGVAISARTTASSSRITSRRRGLLPMMSSKSLILWLTSVSSAWIFSRSNPVRRCRRSSRMPRAWASVSRTLPPTTTLPSSWISDSSGSISAASHSWVISDSRAAAASGAARISAITRSMLATASTSPTSRWPRSRALPRSKRERLRITSSRKAMKATSISRRPISLGWPSFSASMLTPNEVWSWVKR